MPEGIIKRIAGVDTKKQAEEGIAICLETIETLKQLNGVNGIHIMAMGDVAGTNRIIDYLKSIKS